MHTTHVQLKQWSPGVHYDDLYTWWVVMNACDSYVRYSREDSLPPKNNQSGGTLCDVNSVERETCLVFSGEVL